MLTTRQDHRLAAALAAGIVRFSSVTRCTTPRCTNLLLEPIAFNATSRIDGQYICEGCREWEVTQHTKCPEGCGQ